MTAAPLKILQLTPGTGSFYCGSCLRDNALVKALRRQGADAMILSLYLPHVVDEPRDAALPSPPIFLGGINVYLQQKFRFFRESPRWLDWLFNRTALLKLASKRTGMTAPTELGEMTISMLRGEEGEQKKELDKLCEWIRGHDRPDVIVLSNAMLLGMARPLKAASGAKLVCTLQGEDSFLDDLPEPYCSLAWQTLAERAKQADAFVGVSRYYADVMQRRLDLPAERVHAIHNGIDTEGYAVADKPPPPTVGYFAPIVPGKGLHRLVDAFIRVMAANADEPWRLHIAGSCTPANRPYLNEQLAKLHRAGLMSRVQVATDVSREEKIRFLQTVSLLSVPATYGESFGLYVLEAWACGTPVLQPTHAAFPELIDATGGGLLFDPDDDDSFDELLVQMLGDPNLCRLLGKRGHDAVVHDFHIDVMASRVLDLCERVAAGEAIHDGAADTGSTASGEAAIAGASSDGRQPLDR